MRNRPSENILSTRISLCSVPIMGGRQRRHCRWSAERRGDEMQKEAEEVKKKVSCGPC